MDGWKAAKAEGNTAVKVDPDTGEISCEIARTPTTTVMSEAQLYARAADDLELLSDYLTATGKTIDSAALSEALALFGVSQ